MGTCFGWGSQHDFDNSKLYGNCAQAALELEIALKGYIK